jgi:DNA-binding NtrC family response regulator
VDLLRVLQEREIRRLGGEMSLKIDVRIVAATNRDLKKAIEEKRFREDLYYRLNVISIHVPPLRERREDIPLLASAFVHKYCLEMNREELNISPAALEVLMRYPWPGNVRELENVIERSIVIGRGNEILPGDLPFTKAEATGLQYPKSLKLLEKAHIERILKETDWNVSRAAKELEIDRQTLYNKLQRYGITRG